MRKRKLFSLSVTMLAVATMLTSCGGQTITRAQAIQILNDINMYQQSDKYTLTSDIGLTLITEKLDKKENQIIQTYECIHLAFGGESGQRYVFYNTRSYISSEIQSSFEYWAYVKNEYFYEKTTVGSLVDVENDEQTRNGKIFVVETTCNPPKSTEVLALFYTKYALYFDRVTNIIKQYNNPALFAESLGKIDKLLDENYLMEEKYYTVGNRCVEIHGTQSRPINQGKRDLYDYEVEYYDARLTTYYTYDILGNDMTDLDINYASNLTLPKSCETDTGSESVPPFSVSESV